MTMQTPSIAVPAPRRGPGRLGLALAVGAALAVAAGVGLRQANRDGGATDTATPPLTAAERTIAPRPADAETVYVVGSAAQAETVRAALAEAEVYRAQLGESPREHQVTIVTDAEADTVLRMLGEQDAVRAQLGLPSLVVVDLRPQPVAAPEAPATGARAAATPAEAVGGLAELIRDGGAPASPDMRVAAVRIEAGVCGTFAHAAAC